MKFTSSKIADINERVIQKKENAFVSIAESLNGATVFKKCGNMDWAICEVAELSRVIYELTVLKEAIEEETGIQF